jgi:acyl-CoA dehydrogenase
MEEPMTEAFRAETRAWLEANCPPDMRGPIRDEADIVAGGKRWAPAFDAQRVWMDRMAARGWTVPEWPTAYGGGGLSKPETKIVREEMARIGARKPIVSSMGISMLGPALLKYGTEAQKIQHLPPIARGDIAWAQGYSEPNAGSDLASLMTRCDDMGDHFQVTGQKIWTSGADKADWIFVLVRTDREAPKHLGISFVLLDMAQPGVDVRPIKLISGRSPFCETFFDSARAEKHNLLGTLNDGWSIAKYLLTHEREMIGEVFGAMQGRPLSEIAVQMVGTDADGRLSDSFLRADIARAEIDAMAFMATLERVTDQAKAGQGVGAESSVLKYYGTEMNKRRNELLMDCAGSHALEWDADGDAARHWLRSKGNSIEGGTTEVQLNIIAKRVLGLPS